ncbi:uncharacterized protein LOC8278119 [Ricinus communis]|uniref:Uncharacterized protein n=1 Tax=Ricinus communis TaxID=3988 RepID=B9T747_RICCO|nr:uncharacterized protein LOC8278119 [Ricinus communis]EEF28310.1 conserved hypothetical protein [Ricinus communis]|eukprot:XP_025015702.1 uncharacterized protein LOC8278119 [Ricinus communis]
MILHSAAMVALCRPSALRPVCLASNTKINTEQLRTQLDQLHVESDTTRAKANSARLRFMRLSEAAEKLKRQAAISIHSGKENEARELLFQKKKVMQAMERSKSRIELLDQLSAKLNEAISIKESLLIGNIALDLENDSKDASGPVRIISPKEGIVDDKDEDKYFSSVPNGSSNQDLQLYSDDEASRQADKELGSLSNDVGIEDSMVTGLVGISSYEDFLEHLDLQLNRIEAELVTILNVSALVINDEDKPKNSKVQQTIELLDSVRSIRNRIGRIIQGKAETI